MRNALQTKALVSAVLITVLIHGTLLLGLNKLAIEGASTPTAGIPSAASEPHHITLSPVTVLAKRLGSDPSEVVQVASQHEECNAPVVRVSADNASVSEISAC